MGAIFDEMADGFLDYALSAYAAVEPWTIPFIFVGIIGFIYAWTGSVIVAVVGIIFTFGIYAGTTDVFTDVPDLALFLYIVAILGISMLISTFIIKKARGD